MMETKDHHIVLNVRCSGVSSIYVEIEDQDADLVAVLPHSALHPKTAIFDQRTASVSIQEDCHQERNNKQWHKLETDGGEILTQDLLTSRLLPTSRRVE